ncbi:MAG: hypothetical protein WBW78_22955, partial [Terrimicrobiaceae bacterium]
MSKVTSRRIAIVDYRHETLGLAGYSVYFQRWAHVLALTSEAFWDVSAFAEIRLRRSMVTSLGIFARAELVIRLNASIRLGRRVFLEA